jgi:hypothetical protein
MNEIDFWSRWFNDHAWPVERRETQRGTSFHFQEADEDGVPRSRMIFIPLAAPCAMTPAERGAGQEQAHGSRPRTSKQ